jgi:hypothetical protein
MRRGPGTRLHLDKRRSTMHIFMVTIAFLFVIGVLAVCAWALYEMSPFAHHVDQYRDSEGKWIGEPPRLD